MLYKRIRDLQEDHDWTQSWKMSNVPLRTYADYEAGQRMNPPQILCALADM